MATRSAKAALAALGAIAALAASAPARALQATPGRGRVAMHAHREAAKPRTAKPRTAMGGRRRSMGTGFSTTVGIPTVVSPDAAPAFTYPRPATGPAAARLPYGWHDPRSDAPNDGYTGDLVAPSINSPPLDCWYAPTYGPSHYGSCL